MIIVVALAPTWHHATSQWIVHTGSVGCCKYVEGPVQSTMKSMRNWDVTTLLDSKVMLYYDNSINHLPILMEASELLSRYLRL